MADIVQKVKYQVEVSTTELDQFKTAVDNTNAAIGHLNTSFRNLSTSIDQGMLKAFATLNGRISRFNTVAPAAVDSLEKMAAPLGGLATSMTRLAEQFGHFASTTNRALDDLRKFNAEIGRTKAETIDEAEVQSRTLNSKGLKWLKYYGIIRSGWETTKWVFNEIKEGAQNLDLDRVLSKQIDGFEKQIARAQELTAGVSSRASLVRSFALMSSFGLPMQNFANQMELVQKMAIRTGQSADFLTESFARGISRLSPLILDNLGIQVSLSEANLAYANATNKVVTELTKEEKIAAMTEEVLRKLEARTKGVSLTAGSAAAAVMRFETTVKDFWDWIKEMGGRGLETVDQAFSGAAATVSNMIEPNQLLADSFASLDELLIKIGGNRGSIPTLTAQWRGFADAFTAMSRDESLADLFGNDGIFGTTLEQVQSVSATALPEFIRYVKEAQSGIAGINELVQDRPQVQAGGIMAIFQQGAFNAAGALDEVRAQFGGLLSQADMIALKSRLEADARERALRAVKAAVSMSENFEIPLAETLLSFYNGMVGAKEDFVRSQIDAARQTAFMNALNKSLLAGDEARLKAAYEANTAADRMIQLRNGQTLAELALNAITDERQQVLKDLADADKRVHEDIADREARLERDRLLNRLAELNHIREVSQAQVLADKEIVASFQGMTKEKLRAMKTFYEASIKMVEFTLTLPGVSKTPLLEQIQNLRNLMSELDKLISRSGGGGRSPRDEYNPFKPVKGVKPTYYGWTIDDLLDAGGKLEEFRQKLTTPGQVKGGFFGDSMFFGVTSEEDLRKAEDQLTQFYEFRRAAQWRFRNATQQEKDLSGLWDPIFGVEETIKPRLEALARHFRVLNDIARDLNNVTVAMGSFKDGMDGLFGTDIISMVSDFTSGMEGFTEALKANAGAYSLVNSAMPMVRAFTQNIIKNRKAQAWIEALMQGAAAWAAFAEGNIAGGLMHSTAAAMYMAVGGGVLRLPKGKGKDTNPDDSNVKAQAVKGGDRHFHWHGQIATTEAERGAMIREMIRESERAGI